MKTIAHISDLHFGTELPDRVDSLCKQLHQKQPSLTVISGDLTQRARSNQFAAASAYLNRLPQPQIIVPGNHDVPLYDIMRRFVAPLNRYKRYIIDDLNPFYEDEEIAVLGLNTARSLTWKSGRISLEQIERIRTTFREVPTSKFKVLVTHHPFIPPAGEDVSGVDLVGRAGEAIPAIDEAGIDLLLAGHLHHGYSGDARMFYPGAKRSIIVLQAGTATSQRIRHEPNGYNLIQLDRENIVIQMHSWSESKRNFQTTRNLHYGLRGAEWQLL
ncbi:MAG: metallophosphoesterase family protein [Verrucomicrobiales bacterium]